MGFVYIEEIMLDIMYDAPLKKTWLKWSSMSLLSWMAPSKVSITTHWT